MVPHHETDIGDIEQEIQTFGRKRTHAYGVPGVNNEIITTLIYSLKGGLQSRQISMHINRNRSHDLVPMLQRWNAYTRYNASGRHYHAGAW